MQIKIGESGDRKDMVICSAYFPSDSGTPPPPKEFKELVEYYAERKLELLTGCDANTHCTVRDSSDVNSRGEDLCKYLMAQELLVLNKGKAPTFVARVRQEVSDLPRCSLGFQRLVWGWHVFDEPLLSDHRYIVYQIDTPHKTPKMIRNPRNTDWSKLRNELGDKLNHYNGFRVERKDDLEVVAATLHTSIRDSFASRHPEKIIQDKSMWWTKKLNKLRKNTRRKLRVALCQNVPEHWNHIARPSISTGGR